MFALFGLALPRLVGQLVLGGLAGLLAAFVTNWPMSRQPEGYTPAYVTAAVLLRTAPTAVSFRDASLVHHAAGALAGVLYALFALPVAAFLPAASPLHWTLVWHVPAVLAVVGLVYLSFSRVVLPRSGGAIPENRATAVRGQWLRSSLVFGAAMLVAGPALGSLA